MLRKSPRNLCMILIVGIIVAFQIVLFLTSSDIFLRHRTSERETVTGCSSTMLWNRTGKIYTQEDLKRLLTPKKGRKHYPSKSEFDFLIRLRKLVLYSVREVNQRIRGLECALWWANPLSVSKVKVWNLSEGLTKYQLTFEIQPGRMPFQTEVTVDQRRRRNDPGLGYDPEDLLFVNGRRLDGTPTSCGTVPSSLRGMCLCPEETAKAERETKEARQERGIHDPELISWPPNVSMLIPDYITFGTMSFYLKSPLGEAEFCGPEVELLLFVSTHPSNFHGRETIRKTYGNPKFLKEQGVRLLFALDRVTDVKLQDKIDEEFGRYDDLIQGSYAHSYHNLTLRAVSMMNWLMTHCRLRGTPMPRWFMKTDDDYFINIPLALEVAAANPDSEVMGGQSCGQPADRDSSDQMKFYTPKYIHSPEYYGGYVSGACWLIRTDVLPSLLKASLTLPLLPMEDVYITGMLTREVGILPRSLRQTTYERGAGPCLTKQRINSNTNNLTDMLIHWEYFSQPKPTDCELPSLHMKRARELTDERLTRCLFA